MVLDNFEQVIEAAPLVTKLLEATHWVKVLLTSRAVLHVRGEHAFDVTPLPLPSRAAGFEELARNAAVTLFAERARAVDPAFDLTPGNSPLVAAICAHLEGLPLGIELAAARTRQVGLRAMLNRFPSRLELASAGPADAPARQQTLRATIAWSYALLDDVEQRLFSVASVFAGGLTIEAARAVGTALGHEKFDVERCLELLVDQSLLLRIPDDEVEPRYDMLETIREYGLETLGETGLVNAARQAHADSFLALADPARLPGNGRAGGLNDLANEQENVVSALGWYSGQEQWEAGLRLCTAQMPLWHAQDRLRESRLAGDVHGAR